MKYITTTNPSTGRKTITLFTSEGVKTVLQDHPNFGEIQKALGSSPLPSEEEILELIDTRRRIESYSWGHVRVEDDTVYWDGKPMHNAMTRRLLLAMHNGEEFEPIVQFMHNVMKNPSYRAVNELWSFLEVCDLPITDSGRFLAYKVVNDDFTDCHTGTIDNSPGRIVSMPRNEVDDNPLRTCSYGLHVCSREYLKSFMGQGRRLVLVAVNPADVVSVPVDYNHAKMRVCKYEVLAEIEGPKDWNRATVNTEQLNEPEPELDDDPYYQDYRATVVGLTEHGDRVERTFIITSMDHPDDEDVIQQFMDRCEEEDLDIVESTVLILKLNPIED